MKKFGFILMSIILLLSGCDNGSANEQVKEENKTDYFNLAIESDKNIYKGDEHIQISSYLEYVGEKSIELDPKPSITIVVRDYEGGKIVEQIDFIQVEKTMKKGKKFSNTVDYINLEKGKYDAFVTISPFLVGSSQFILSTVPIIFEIR